MQIISGVTSRAQEFVESVWHDVDWRFDSGTIYQQVYFDGISCPDSYEKPFFVSESTDAYADLSYLSKEPEIESFTIEFWVKVANAA